MKKIFIISSLIFSSSTIVVSSLIALKYIRSNKQLSEEQAFDELKRNVTENINDYFKVNSNILPSQVTEESIKFTLDSFENSKIDWNIMIIPNSANDDEGYLRIDFVLKYKEKTLSFDDVLIFGFKTNKQIEMEILDKLLLESSFKPKNPKTIVSNINMTNIANEIIWLEQENNRDINILYKKVLVNEFTGEVSIDYSLKRKNYETRTKTKIVGKWKNIIEKTKEELELIAKESSFLPLKRNDESVLPSTISEANAKDEIIWQQQKQNIDIEIEYISNSFVSNDKEGSLSFKFKLGKRINTEMIWTNEWEIKNPILGYKTTFQDEKEKLDFLAKNSTFSIVNTSKIPSQITKENIKNEIIWDQQANNSNVNIEFIKVENNDILGSLEFNYKLIFNNIEVVNQKQVTGLQTTEQHLNEILTNATFNVLNKERLASTVKKHEIIWNEENDKKNEKVLIDFVLLDPDDEEGVLNLKIIFSKDNIEKELNTNIENDKSIKMFKTLSSYIDEITPKSEIWISEKNNKNWSSDIKNIKDLLNVLTTKNEQEFFQNSFTWEPNKYSIRIVDSKKYFHNFGNGTLTLFFEIESKINKKITKTFSIAFKGFKTFLDLTNEIPSKINIKSNDINIEEINESNFSNILDWDQKVEIINKIPITEHKEKIYLTNYELLSIDKANKKIEFRMNFALNQNLKQDNNIEILPNEKSFSIEINIFVDRSEIIDSLQNFVFERKEITIDNKTIKVLPSIGMKELSNLGQNFDELNKILKKEFVLPNEKGIEISFSQPKLQEEKNSNHFIIIVSIKWKAEEINIQIPIKIFNYFPKKWECFLVDFYENISSKTLMINNTKYKKSKNEFIKEWNNKQTTEKKLELLKDSLFDENFQLIKNVLDKYSFDISFGNIDDATKKGTRLSGIEIEVFVKNAKKLVEYPSWPTQIFIDGFLT